MDEYDEYKKEDLWKLFEKLPSDLKDAIFSEETASDIYSICKRNGIKEDGKQVSAMAKLVGQMLMGLLNPEKFKNKLKTNLEISEQESQKISTEVNRLILFPVKGSLLKFYKGIEFTPSGKIIKQEKIDKQRGEIKKAKPIDIYREKIE